VNPDPDPMTPPEPTIPPESPALTPAVPEVVPSAGPGVFDLVVRSARLGVDAANLMAGEVADFSVRVARAVLPPAVAGGPLDAVDERLGRQRSAARERGEQSVEQTKEAAEAVLNQVVIGVVDMLDMEQLIDHVPIDKIVARVDVPGIVNEVDLGDIVRESTTGLAGETIDGIRVQVMGIDLFVARIIDRVLFRKRARDISFVGYDVEGPEVRTPKALK